MNMPKVTGRQIQNLKSKGNDSLEVADLYPREQDGIKGRSGRNKGIRRQGVYGITGLVGYASFERHTTTEAKQP